MDGRRNNLKYIVFSDDVVSYVVATMAKLNKQLQEKTDTQKQMSLQDLWNDSKKEAIRTNGIKN